MTSLQPIGESRALEGEGADHFEAQARRTKRFAQIAGLVLLAVTLIGGVLIPMEGAVVAFAQVIPESRVKRIAHPTGGVISAIEVGEGDLVKQGDVLMRFDTNVSAVDADQSQRTLEQLLAQKARLEAEIAGSAYRVPASLAARNDEAARAAVDAERRRLSLDRAERASQVAAMGQRQRQLSSQIAGYEAQLASIRHQRKLIQPELEGVRTLREQGYVTINQLNRIERTAADLEGSEGALQANIMQAQAGIGEVAQQRTQVAQEARSKASAELAQVEAAISGQRVASAGAADRFDRSAIRAPYSGRVEKLAFHAIGEVVTPAQTILEIVPNDDRPVLRGAVSPIDIDRVREGQQARIRLTAFNADTTPEVTGTVVFVASDPTTDERAGTEYYPVRVMLDAPSQRVARKLGLVPGMPAEMFITTGSRSLISYLTKPFTDQFARAFVN